MSNARQEDREFAELVREAPAEGGRPVALAPSTLSSQFQRRLEEETGMRPLYLTLSELRRKSLPSAIRLFASLRGCRLLLAFETEDSVLLQPMLEAVGLAARPSRIEVLRPDFSRSAVSRWHAVPALASVVGASAKGQLAVKSVRRELRRLMASPRTGAVWTGTRHVLYLNGNLWIGVKAGGSIGHVAGVVNGLHAAGYEVEMATVVEPIGVDVAVNVQLLQPPDPFGLPFETNHYRFQRTMTRNVRSAEPGNVGFVYQRMSAANYSGVVISRRLNVPYVLEYNGSEVWIAANWGTPLRHQRVALLAEEACLRHAHLVVTVSETLRRELVERGVEPDRIVAHPNGVDPDLFDPSRFDSAHVTGLRAGYGIPADALVVGFIGTFGQWHGAEVLARAIVRMNAENPGLIEDRKLRFLFVGDGLRLPAVREILAQHEVSALASFTGLVAQDEAPVHLAACDVLVSPHVPNVDGSPFFGSPTKLFEYMAMGRAIVASRLDQIGEVLGPGLDARSLPIAEPSGNESQLAVLTEPGDEEELADALRFIVAEPEWRTVLGRNARAAILSHYTWKHHVAAFLSRIEAGQDG